SRLRSSLNDPLESLQRANFKGQLASVIASLAEREQMVMSLYYNEELNLKEIGHVLEISESRVSQIHSKALKNIRAQMQDWMG
ncbi:RNA polymerase sigma factor for flagellar operon, partial [hydrothermal vent metagenome]